MRRGSLAPHYRTDDQADRASSRSTDAAKRFPPPPHAHSRPAAGPPPSNPRATRPTRTGRPKRPRPPPTDQAQVRHPRYPQPPSPRPARTVGESADDGHRPARAEPPTRGLGPYLRRRAWRVSKGSATPPTAQATL